MYRFIIILEYTLSNCPDIVYLPLISILQYKLGIKLLDLIVINRSVVICKLEDIELYNELLNGKIYSCVSLINI